MVEDVKNRMEAQSEGAAQLKKAQLAVRRTRSGNMRGVIQAMTGRWVAEGDEQTEKEIRKLIVKELAPSDRKFNEEMTEARKTMQGRVEQPRSP